MQPDSEFEVIPTELMSRPVGGQGGKCDLSGLSADEQTIISRESGGNPSAKNPHSTAFGLGQLTIANRRKYNPSNPGTTDCGTQVNMFRGYVKDRYGTASRARAFHDKHHYY